MFGERTHTDYKFALEDDKTERVVPSDLPAVEDWLQRLARAIRQCHIYPISSPLCLEAVVSCQGTLASFDSRQRLSFRISPHEVIVDDVGVGSGSVIGQEIARRLHRANVSAISFDRAASVRDLTRFCEAVARSDTLALSQTTLADALLDHGIDSISVEMAHRPEVLDLGVPQSPLVQLVEAERRRRQALPSGGPVSHLYPPDKGWVRVDPSSRFNTISLIDLAILVDDPAEIAAMLLRLTDDEPISSHSRGWALEQKFSDVATLFSSMEPQLARVMFAKLARAVLNLESDRREALLRRTILPGLLDGEPSGDVMRDFADVDLAESLCLLLDLETAAPEVLATALQRLEIPASRRDHLVPLLEAQLRARQGRTPEHRLRPESGVDRHARKLIQIESGVGRSLAEFAAFDLSMDEPAAAALAVVRADVSTSDVSGFELQCLRALVKLEPNPAIARALLERATALLERLERTARWADLARQIAQYLRVAETLTPSRPDIAKAVLDRMWAFWTPERARRVAALYAADGAERTLAGQVVESCGVSLLPAFLTMIDEPGPDAAIRGAAALLCEHARLLAPALVGELAGSSDRVAPVLVRALGFAGHGYENAIADQLGRRAEQTDREALRALVRIGTCRAAAVVADYLLKGRASARAAAEEALWHFPPDQTAAQVRDLLARREFVRQHPDIAGRLLDRAAQAKPAGLEPVLTALTPFRFWFWNPRLVRVSRKARLLLAQ